MNKKKKRFTSCQINRYKNQSYMKYQGHSNLHTIVSTTTAKSQRQEVQDEIVSDKTCQPFPGVSLPQLQQIHQEGVSRPTFARSSSAVNTEST